MGNKATQTFDDVMAMDNNGHLEASTIAVRMCQILLETARREDILALSKATALLSASLKTQGMGRMPEVLPQHKKYLRDAFGSPITEGCRVVDHDHQVGYVRLDLGPHFFGPDSAYWDGWFNVTPTRSGDPLRGKVTNGELVRVLRGGRP